MTGELRIGIDLDGVLYKWSPTARFLLSHHKGYDLSEEASSWDYIQERVSPEDWSWLWTVGIERGLFRHGSLYKGAVEGLTALRELGRLVVVTHRPETAVQDTFSWVAHHRLPVQEVVILSQGESKQAARCDIYVDDAPKVALDLHEVAKPVIMWSRPWNADFKPHAGEVSDCPFFRRASSWAEVVALVDIFATEGW